MIKTESLLPLTLFSPFDGHPKMIFQTTQIAFSQSLNPIGFYSFVFILVIEESIVPLTDIAPIPFNFLTVVTFRRMYKSIFFASLQ